MKQEEIGAFIANIRKEQGWTQKDMAFRLGVSDKAISKWETGKSLPDMGTLIPVSELLGITVDELLSGKRRDNGDLDANENEPNKVIIDYAARTIARVKKNYRLVPAALVGIFILSLAILSGLGYSFGPNTQPESPLKGMVERAPMNSISKAVMTEEEQALSNFANGVGSTTKYLTYRFSGDKKLQDLGLYMFDGTKWSTSPILSNGESQLGLISLAVNGGIAEVGLYEADGYASYSATRPLAGYQESWVWGSGIPDQPYDISETGTLVLTFWVAKENDVIVEASDMQWKPEAEWLAGRGSLEENAYVVALYVVVE